MKRFVFLCLAALAITAFAGVTATMANAENSLPSLLVLEEKAGEFKITGELAGTEVAKFNSTFAKLTASSVKVLLTASNMAKLGKIDLHFGGTKLGAKNCTTEGDAVGVVLIPLAEWHLVLIIPPEIYAFWLLIPKTKIGCEGFEITVEGSVLTPIAPEGATKDTTKFLSKAECETVGSRKAKFKEFPTDTGTGKAELKGKNVLATEEVCEELTAAIPATSEDMMELMEP